MPSPTESATVVPTPRTNAMPSDFKDDDVAVAVASMTRNIDARTLHDRCPSVDDVLTEVKSMPTVQQFFNNSRHFTKKSDPDLFFNEHDLWRTVSEKLMNAISKYTPIDEKDAEKKTKLHVTLGLVG